MMHYDFVVKFNKVKSFRIINADTLRKVSIKAEKVLAYYYDTKARIALIGIWRKCDYAKDFEKKGKLSFWYWYVDF